MNNIETEVYLIRHGDVRNPWKKIYGRLPGFHLSEEGREQAKRLGQTLKARNVKPAAIYSSPLERAMETAQILGQELGVSKVVANDDILEIDIPSFQGLIKPIFTKAIGVFVGGGDEFSDPNTEPVEKIIERVSRFLEQIKDKHKGEQVAVVSHGHPTRLLIWSLEHPGELPDPHVLRDDSYLAKGAGVLLKFSEGGDFIGLERIDVEGGEID